MSANETIKISAKMDKIKGGITPGGTAGGGGVLAFLVVWIVKVTLATLPLGVTPECEKVHVAPGGMPVPHASSTCLLNPLMGVTEIVYVAGDPATIVLSDGE